jgi:tetratricopeptide (TPR) repeat protein
MPHLDTSRTPAIMFARRKLVRESPDASKYFMPNKNKKTRAAQQSVPPTTPVNAAEKPKVKFQAAPWMKHLYVAAALFVITLGAYSNSFRAGFPLDNDPLILQDPRVHAVTSENISAIINHSAWFVPPEKGLYRPLTTLTYLFNYAALGNADRPEGYHFINFLIHFVNVLLCYGLALVVLRKFWPAIFIAALWAVHPVLTESVTNIIGRADLVAACGVLSGLLMYRMSRESTGAPRVAWLVGVMLATAVGIFSKESAIAILGLIALWEIAWPKQGGQLRNLAAGLIAAGLPIIAFLIQRSIVLARSTVPVFPYADNPLLGAGFFTARMTALKVLANYLWMLIWPAKLSWNYYYSQIPLSRGTLADWIAWIVIAAAICGVCIAFRRNRAVFFFAAFAFIALIPVSNLLILIGSIMADRFLYLPAIGFAACIVIGVYALGERLKVRALAPVVLALIIIALGIRTWSRNLDWQNNSTLLEAGIRDTPNSFASHFGLATNLYLSDPSHANLDRVIAEAEKSLAILDPLPDSQNFEDAYANAGTYYQLKGDLLGRSATGGNRTASAESFKAYQRALQILLRGAAIGQSYDDQIRAREIARGKSDSEVPHVGSKSLYPEIALTYLRLSDTQKAHDAIQRALVIDPEQPKTFVTLARILLTEKRTDEAAVTLVESYMASGDQGVLGPLAQLYGSGLDPKGCAVSQSANGLSLNTFCEPVHQHICRAKAELIRVYTNANRHDLIDELRSRTATDTTCDTTLRK